MAGNGPKMASWSSTSRNLRITLLVTEKDGNVSERIITSTLAGTHLGEDVKEGVCVGVDHWRDVRDAARHVRLHDRHLDEEAN